MDYLPRSGWFMPGDRYLVNKMWQYGTHYYPQTEEFVFYFGEGFEFIYERSQITDCNAGHDFWTQEKLDEFLHKWTEVWGYGDGKYGIDLIGLKEGFHKWKDDLLEKQKEELEAKYGSTR